jgi:C4-dicarboxylate transporter DctM subunit
MDVNTVGYLAFVVLIGLIFLGVPIAWAITLVAAGGLTYLQGPAQAAAQFYTTGFNAGTEFLFASIPLFIFMGQIVNQARIGEDLFDALYKWFGRLPGGLAITSVASCAAFGAVTGVSSAAIGTMGKMVIPEMKRYRYDMRLACGSLATAATIAIMIPPSLLMVLYGLWTETSIGKLFIGGIVPGLLTAAIFSAYICIRCMIDPALGPLGPKASWSARFLSLAKLVPIGVIFGVVIGGMYAGVFTPGEAAGVGAGAVVVVAVAMRRLSWAGLVVSIEETARLSVMIFAILVSASVLSRFLVSTQVTTGIINWIAGTGYNRYAILALIVLLYLMLGCILDAFGMILLTLPFVFPIIINLGFDPIWFGVILTLLTEIALVTPPVGINVYILSRIVPDVPMQEMFIGAVPFVLLALGVILLLTVFPGLVLWLPGKM